MRLGYLIGLEILAREYTTTMSIKRIVLLCCTAALSAAALASGTGNPVSTEPRALKPDRQMERAARDLANNLPQMHLSRKPCDDRIATNAIKLFIDSLDFDHCYFMASDIEAFAQSATLLDDQLAEGNLEFPFRVFGVFLDRVSNRVAFVERALKEGFDLGQSESYVWKRRDAHFAKDEKEWDDLWHKRIKNQYVARKVSDALGTNDTDLASAAEKESTPPTHSDTAESKMKPDESILKGYSRFYTVLKDNDAQWLVERYLNAFTLAYDPHSSYMSPDSHEDFEISMNLSLVGIGALLSSEDGAAKVERIIPGGPADRDGRLKPGDKIVAVGQGDEPAVDILHLPLSKTVRLIRGKKDTKVVLKYIPVSDASGTSSREIVIVRGEVKLEESAAKGEVREIITKEGEKLTLGVITLPEFYADMRQSGKGDTEPRYCSKDVARIIADLKKQDVEGIVLDLRNNGGGSLSEAINLAGLFVPTGPVVQVKDQRRVQQLVDEIPGVLYDGPLIVLVNRFSASASEIVAAALQDYGRAILVGDSKTHGKGTVQSLTSLSPLRPSLGSVKVTTASFYRIAGGSTQLKGVVPDIVIPSTLEALEVGEEYLPNAMPWSSVGPAEYQHDTQTDAIIATLREKSEMRRVGDQKFAILNDLRTRLEKQQKAKEITLKYDERLALARSDKQLQKQMEENEPGKPDPTGSSDKEKEEKKKKNDIVLNESLNILSDWIRASETKAASTAATDPNHT